MKTIFLHGLGQDCTSWERTAAIMGNGTDVYCPSLPDWLLGKEVCYENLYQALEEYCEPFHEPFCLCGLSLGGILALQYAIAHSDQVAALVLIGTQYQMPKKLLKLQNILFRFMPNAAFQGMGFGFWERFEKGSLLDACGLRREGQGEPCGGVTIEGADSTGAACNPSAGGARSEYRMSGGVRRCIAGVFGERRLMQRKE